MHIITSIFERGRYAWIVSSIIFARDKTVSLESILNELDSTILQTLDEGQGEHFQADVLRSAQSAEISEARMTKDYVLCALTLFLLVFVSTFPVLTPFLEIGEVSTALRLSHLFAIVMLFAIGYDSTRYTNSNRVRSGMTMVLLWITIVTVTVLLGG